MEKVFIKISTLIIAFTVMASPSIASNQESSVGFVLSSQEDQELSKWSNYNSTLDDLAKDALKCDPAALCLIGYNYLYGMCGQTIDVAIADKYFSMAASLGFAPAIDEVANAYLTRNPNMFLGFVYKNLAISFGHQELVLAYHECRIGMSAQFGSHICEKIEKIAARKKELILKNQKKLSEAQNKIQFFNLGHSNDLITDEDCSLGKDYWDEILKSSIESK